MNDWEHPWMNRYIVNIILTNRGFYKKNCPSKQQHVPLKYVPFKKLQNQIS